MELDSSRFRKSIFSPLKKNLALSLETIFLFFYFSDGFEYFFIYSKASCRSWLSTKIRLTFMRVSVTWNKTHVVNLFFVDSRA